MPERKDPQINLRLPRNRRAVLDAAAFVEDRTTTEFVREHIEELIDQWANDPTVEKALEARRERQAAKEGKLSHLQPPRASRSAVEGESD